MKNKNAGCDRCGTNDRAKGSKLCVACESSSRHTKGPWWLEMNCVQGKNNENVATICDEGNSSWKANAAFIVRACNNHDELLEALKTLREDIRMLKDGEWVPDEDSCDASLDVADKAIENAEDK